ncbi:MAG: MBL fold metallo-hydrolase [Patescibacteria group bacterium]|jgi:L-ascorbate metabolism protein UlaG (beta-lactamase superfamily)
MNIYWFGQNCFKIEGEKSILVTDPFDNSLGLKVPRLAADVITLSQPDNETNNEKSIKGVGENPPFLIASAGEYEVKNIFIYGIAADSKETEKKKGATQNLIYRFEIDGVSLAHLGNLDHILENGQMETLEGVDILIIPVGGNSTINAKQATEVISQLEPRIVIPMAYDLPGLKLKGKLDGISSFCKEIGVCPKENLNKFKISKKDLPQQDLQVVILQP